MNIPLSENGVVEIPLIECISIPVRHSLQGQTSNNNKKLMLQEAKGMPSDTAVKESMEHAR
jgi:hypothetical protein